MGDVGWVVSPYPGLAMFGYTSYIFGEKELEYFQGGTWATADAILHKRVHLSHHARRACDITTYMCPPSRY